MNLKNFIELLKTDITKAESFRERVAIISKYAKIATKADRISLFIYNKEKEQLRSLYAEGIKGSIAIRSNAGVVGYAFHKKESVIENDTASSKFFLKIVDNVDKKTGYHTRSILAVPISDPEKRRLGMLQLLNKEGGFTEQDKKVVEAIAAIAAEVLSKELIKTQKKNKKEKKEEVAFKKLQEAFEHYLADKKLYFMDDGNIYYKILDMRRDYYIGADKCYLLTETPQKIELYYCSIEKEFLPVNMFVKLDARGEGLWCSKTGKAEEFTHCQLELDEE